VYYCVSLTILHQNHNKIYQIVVTCNTFHVPEKLMSFEMCDFFFLIHFKILFNEQTISKIIYLKKLFFFENHLLGIDN